MHAWHSPPIDPEIPKKSNVIIQTSDNNNWIFWVLGTHLVQFLSNSSHLLRRYGENDEDVFLLTKCSHADNSAEKDNNVCLGVQNPM